MIVIVDPFNLSFHPGFRDHRDSLVIIKKDTNKYYKFMEHRTQYINKLK